MRVEPDGDSNYSVSHSLAEHGDCESAMVCQRGGARMREVIDSDEKRVVVDEMVGGRGDESVGVDADASPPAAGISTGA
jgi:hypothetical protein